MKRRPTIKIRLTTTKCGTKSIDRASVAREAYVDVDLSRKEVTLKNGACKCKPFDPTVSRKTDRGYIKYRKDLYSGLIFHSRADAKQFMENHREELAGLASGHPLFHKWDVVTVTRKFKPATRVVYGKDWRE